MTVSVVALLSRAPGGCACMLVHDGLLAAALGRGFELQAPTAQDQPVATHMHVYVLSGAVRSVLDGSVGQRVKMSVKEGVLVRGQ